MNEDTHISPLLEGGTSTELPDFEDFARRAVNLGFTVHLTHYRFHPAHTAWAPQCQSRVQLSIIAISEDAKARFGSPSLGFSDVHEDTVAAVLSDGRLMLDRFESGEDLTGLGRYEGLLRRKSKPATRSPRKLNLTDEERERRRQRKLDYWANKRAEPAG